MKMTSLNKTSSKFNNKCNKWINKNNVLISKYRFEQIKTRYIR